MIRRFFYLQKSDRRVVLSLLAIIVLAVGVIFFTGDMESSTPPLMSADSLRQAEVETIHHQSLADVPSPKAERFSFDPNTADSTQLRRLGLQDWQIRNIYKYRAAGGIYRKPLDFARLYGLTIKQYRELEPYIRISSDYLPASTLVSGPPNAPTDTTRPGNYTDRKKHNLSSSVKIGPTERIVLNLADTTQLQSIPGIGPYFARKIVEYGERLGGYVSVSQLNEIEDFPPEAAHYLIIRNPAPRQLNINQLSLNELKRHPYINFYRAKAIVDYRRLHGPIHSLQDLRLLKDFPSTIITRLEPYITY